MGPRACERGNRRRRTRPGADVWASMGPRSCERGNAIGEQEVHQACKEASMGPRSCERGNDSGRYSGERIAQFASMGPRSCERGNCAALPREWRCAHWLQWGRARASAEMARYATLPTSCAVASMGPRSCERGNDPGDRYEQLPHSASMGPRSCERGNAALATNDTTNAFCFNGAALVRARKWQCTRRGAWLSRPASMGPRSCERGNHSEVLRELGVI